MVWCVRYAQTYVFIPMGLLVAAESIQKMLDEALYTATEQLLTHGDGPLRSGQFFSTAEQTAVHVWNVNNHQTTWGVLSAALNGLLEYMSSTAFGQATFTVHDGGILVGEGFVGLVQNQ